MARNEIRIDASPERVFEILADPNLYVAWVVGARDVRGADPEWPAVASLLRYTVGFGPLRHHGSTEVVHVDPPRLLALRTRLPVVGSIEAIVEVRSEAAGCLVTLEERLEGFRPLPEAADVLLHVRNSETLRRLKSVAESGSGVGVLDFVTAFARAAHWLDEPPYAEIRTSTERCYLAVSERSGPHVTPTAFGYALGKLWLFADRDSVKTRVVQRSPVVGVLIRSGGRAIVLSGRAEVLDPLQPWSFGLHPIDAAHAVPAAASYTCRNLQRIGSYVAASPETMFRLAPMRRVLLAIRPQRTAIVDGGRVLERRGDWPRPDTADTDGSTLHQVHGESLPLAEVPDDVSLTTTERRAEAVVGWNSVFGPLALPARWHPERSLASIPSGLLAGSPLETRACLCLEAESGPDLEEQKGLLVRGTGRVVASGEYAAVAFAQDRATFWEGADTETVTTA